MFDKLEARDVQVIVLVVSDVELQNVLAALPDMVKSGARWPITVQEGAEARENET